jgi:hypothetical protein
MTLHITTITPNHIISVSDRLNSTSSIAGSKYREIDNDLYKHVVLLNKSARMTICYAGHAGLTTAPRQTLDWLTRAVSDGNTRHLPIDELLAHVTIAANDYIAQFVKQGIPVDALRLVIFATGWVGTKEYGDVQYNGVIDNCIDKYWTWAPKARPKFTMRYKHFGNFKFKDGFTIAYLGNDRLGLKQRALIRVLEKYAKEENPRKIFESSVNIIRAAAAVSDGTIGYNCSGTRNSRDDPGMEVFDSRNNVKHGVMPNTIFTA